MTDSAQQFQQQLLQSGLMSETELQAVLNHLPEETQSRNGEELARLLVQQQKLTTYQVEQLFAGRGRFLVLGNYVVLDELGRGGMGVVLKAEHRRMDRVVALKVLSAAMTDTPEAVLRFQREVKAAARLEHPNIVVAYDADEADGAHFLVMQFVEGIDLSSFVKERGALSIDRAVPVIQQVAQGLEYAHSRGVVHRDIKPANLLLGRDGTVRILDMGLARLESAGIDQDQLTGSNQIMGTVDYMAPEQAKNTKNADARADIYSLGVTLWYLLTARPLFKADSVVNKLLAHQSDPIPSLREACPTVSAELEAVFTRMVAKNPDDRYQNMSAVLADLKLCSGSLVSTPTMGAVHSEDSRLNEFLSNLESSRAHSTVTQKSSDEEQIDAEIAPTVTLKTDSSDTDPQTQHSLDALQVSQPAPASRRSEMQHRSRRSLIPGLAGLALLACVAAVIVSLSSGDRSTSTTEKADGNDSMSSERGSGPQASLSGNQVTNAATKTGITVAAKKPAPIDYALSFDGEANEVVVPTLFYDGSHPITIETTVTMPEVIRSGEIWLLVSAWNFVLFTSNGTDNGVPMVSSEGGGDKGKVSIRGERTSPALKPEKSYQLAAVYTGQDMALFIDGAKVPVVYLDHSGTAPRPNDGPVVIVNEWKYPLRIGALTLTRDNNRQVFHGLIDEVRISNVARYSESYKSQKRLTTDEHTLALFHFDEGEGDRLIDSSGNDHHGVIHGATWVLADGSPAPDRGDWKFAAPTNLGDVVNSPQDDTEPVLSADGLTLIFASNRPGGSGSDDLWMSTRTSIDEPFTKPVNLGEQVNSSRDDTAPTLSSDGRRLIFASNRSGGRGDFDLWISSRTSAESEFRTPVNLSTLVNSPYLDSEPTLSEDSKQLFFCSNRPGGKSQLWVTTRTDESQEFGRPVNLGDEFQVSQTQRSPSLADHDSRVFFQVGRSNGDPGILYLARRLTHAERFESPVPLLGPVNTESLETAPYVSSHGRTLFFASNRKGGYGELDLWWSSRDDGQTPNYALRFDGQTSLADIRTLEIDPATPLTIEAFATAFSAPLGQAGISDTGFIVRSDRTSLRLQPDAKWSIMGDRASRERHLISRSKMSPGRRVHLASVHDGKVLRFYLDGRLQSEVSAREIDQKIGWVSIGAAWANLTRDERVHCFDGIVDELRISRIVRYDSDFIPLERFEPDEHTVGLYHFDEGSGDQFFDSSGNGNHGTTRGATWVNADGSALKPLNDIR